MQYRVNFFQNLVKIYSELMDELKFIPKKLLQAIKAEIIPFNIVKDLDLNDFIEICLQNVGLLTDYNIIFQLPNKFGKNIDF